ncbi:MAG: AI-2E family transporter [Burkholderiaceae bacterium]
MPLTPRQTQTVIWTAVAAVLVIVLLKLGPVLTPFIMAAILAYVLEPGVRGMVRLHLPRWLATLIMVGLAFLAAALVLLILLPIVQQEVQLIRDKLPGVIGTFTQDVLPWLREKTGMEIRLDVASIRTWFAENLSNIGDDIAAKIFAYARSGWGAALEIISLLLLVPVVAFFMLLDWEHMMSELRELVPVRWKAYTADLVSEVDTLLGQYLRGQIKVLMIMATYYSIALAIAGYHLWAPIGILSGLLMIVPYVGFAVSLVFALIDGMLVMGPLYATLTVALIYGVAQALESFVLTPRLVGESIGLHPLAVIFALLAFGALFGFVGVLLALPLAAILAVALRRIRRVYRDSEFFHREA